MNTAILIDTAQMMHDLNVTMREVNYRMALLIHRLDNAKHTTWTLNRLKEYHERTTKWLSLDTVEHLRKSQTIERAALEVIMDTHGIEY